MSLTPGISRSHCPSSPPRLPCLFSNIVITLLCFLLKSWSYLWEKLCSIFLAVSFHRTRWSSDLPIFLKLMWYFLPNGWQNSTVNIYHIFFIPLLEGTQAGSDSWLLWILLQYTWVKRNLSRAGLEPSGYIPSNPIAGSQAHLVFWGDSVLISVVYGGNFYYLLSLLKNWGPDRLLSFKYLRLKNNWNELWQTIITWILIRCFPLSSIFYFPIELSVGLQVRLQAWSFETKSLWPEKFKGWVEAGLGRMCVWDGSSSGWFVISRSVNTRSSMTGNLGVLWLEVRE